MARERPGRRAVVVVTAVLAGRLKRRESGGFGPRVVKRWGIARRRVQAPELGETPMTSARDGAAPTFSIFVSDAG